MTGFGKNVQSGSIFLANDCTVVYDSDGGSPKRVFRREPIMQLGMGAVSKISGASRRQLIYWQESGLVKPSAKATGHRRYTFPDIVAAKTVMVLRRQGCSLQQIRKAVTYLRKHYPMDTGADVLSTLTLLTDGKAVYMLTDADAIMEVVSKQTVLWIVNIGKLILEARRAADALPLRWTESVSVRKRPYQLRVEHDVDEGGYTVQCIELPGAIEQGDTADEAIANGKAAIESVLEFLAKRAGRRSAAKAKVKRRA